jgi:hypothetical protein
MKKLSFSALVFGMLLFAATASKAVAQDVPRGINYQAVARTASGQLMANQNLSIRISLLSPSSTNQLVYEEVQSSIQTNQYGLFNLVIGQGVPSGTGAISFSLVDWSIPDIMIKIEADLGSGYVDMGTTSLWSVPYALHAANGTPGPQGEVGPQGPAGADGATGVQGPQGEQGIQGPQGVDGAQGPIGLTGPQGEVGPQGPAGAAGADGLNGLDGATGPQGPQGIAGVDGAQGPQGEIGPQGPAGLNGLDGATGPQGPQGIAGVDGAQGPQGEVGPQGPAGLNGLDGATGPQGPQGIAGVDGAQGPQGEVGPQGPAGADGLNGLDGATGPMGPQGPAGLNGLDGATGPMGPQGPQGISGGLAWTSDRPYVAGEVVVYQGETYICQFNNDGEPGGIFPTDETYFAPYSLVGPQGPQGEMGPQGPTGSSSANVLTGVVAVENGGTGMDLLGGANQQIRVNADGSALEYFTPSITGVQNLNGATETNQSLATGNAGNDFNISTDAGVHTLNIPDAGVSSRGLITTGNQTIGGEKTFNNPVQINSDLRLATSEGNLGYQLSTDGENLSISHTGVMDNQLYLQSNGDVQVRNNLLVSGSGQTGGGLILADDGDMVDMNNGFATMRFSSGVQITNGNRSGDPVITLGSNGNVSGNAFIKTNGTGNQFLKADGSVDETDYATANDLTNLSSNYLPLSGGTLSGNLSGTSSGFSTLTLSQSGNTPFLNLPSEMTMSTTDQGDLVLRNLDQLRFTDANDWDYSSWAGLAYKRANNQVVLGFPDGNNFLGGNSGTLLFSNVNEAYMGNTDNVVIHSGNYQSKITSLSNLTLTQTGATPFLSLPSEMTMSTTDAGDLVFRNLDQLRFTDANDWDYSSWAGLAYKRATNQIVLGFPDGNNFLGSTTGTLFFSNVNNAYIGNTNQEIIHTGNLSQFALPKPADAGVQGQILSLSIDGTTAWVNTRTEVADEVLAGAGQTDFTLSQAPSSASKVKMYVNGIRISNAAYSISGTTLSYDANNNGAYVLSAGDRIQFDYSY